MQSLTYSLSQRHHGQTRSTMHFFAPAVWKNTVSQHRDVIVYVAILQLVSLLIVYIGYPESQSEWNSLFSSILKTRVLDEEVKLLQQKEDLFSAFCQDLDHAKGFCAADLKAVLDTAHLSAVHEILEQSKKDQKSQCQVMIRKHHIVSAFKRTRPSLLPSDKSKFQRFFRPFLGEDNKNGCLEWIDSSMKMNPNTDKEYSYSGIKLKTSLR